MYTFNQINKAILTAPQNAVAFPFKEAGGKELATKLRNKPYLKPLIEEIRVEADRAVIADLPPITFSLFHLYESTGDRAAYELVYFERRKRVIALAISYYLDETSGFLEALENLLWEICNEYTWVHPAHLSSGDIDLFAAETAHALAETLLLLENALNPFIVERIRNEIQQRIFHPYLNGSSPFWWEISTNNWASVCAGAVGMTALLLVKDRDVLSKMIDRVYRTMECFLEGHGEDGGCVEGITYWVYGFGYYVYFSEMLFEWTAGSLDMMCLEKVKKIAEFPLGVSLFDDHYVNYSDASEAHLQLHTGLASKLLERTGKMIIAGSRIPSFHVDHCYRWAHTTRNLFWTDKACLDQSLPDGNYYFSDLAWVLSRTRVDKRSMAFSARGGRNNEPHNHNDLGHFILHLGEESILTDLGAGVYTKEYFGTNRNDIINNSSSGHSVPIINDQHQSAGSDFYADVLHYEDKENGITFKLDLTRGYELRALTQYTRTFDWHAEPDKGTACLDMIDSFTFKEPGKLEEVFISLHEPKINDGGILWRGAAGQIELCFNNELFHVELDRVDELDHYNKPRIVYRIRLVLNKSVVQDEYHFSFRCLLD